MLELENYELRPNPVQAVIVTRENVKDVAEWCGGNVIDTAGYTYLDVPSIEGFRRIPMGDVVIYNEDGKFYPLSRTTFERRYRRKE